VLLPEIDLLAFILGRSKKVETIKHRRFILKNEWDTCGMEHISMLPTEFSANSDSTGGTYH